MMATNCLFLAALALASQNDWEPLDIMILGVFLPALWHINVGLNGRLDGLRAEVA